MDVEKTIEYILQLQAKSEELHARTEAELAQVAVNQNRLSRDIVRLARLGVKSRSRINGRLENHDRWFAEQKELMQHMGEKLDALVNYVDRLPRIPPQS
jgi:hypothetical protein